MTIVLLTAALLAALALLAAAERTIRRERVEAAEMVDRVRAELLGERDRAAEERRELYQRIQAPEVAVAEAHRERRGPYVRREPVGADDDAAFAARSAERQALRDAEVNGG